MLDDQQTNEAFRLNTHQMPLSTHDAEHCMLSHDMNNCVAIIRGECDLLFDLISDNPEALKRLQVIDETARRMSTDIRTRPCPIKL